VYQLEFWEFWGLQCTVGKELKTPFQQYYTQPRTSKIVVAKKKKENM
jgi:hypothetical protein